MTLLNDPRPISADSHAIESSEVFEGLAERFGDDALRIVHSEGNGDWITIPNQPKRARNVAIMCLAGTRLTMKCHCLGRTRLNPAPAPWMIQRFRLILKVAMRHAPGTQGCSSAG